MYFGLGNKLFLTFAFKGSKQEKIIHVSVFIFQEWTPQVMNFLWLIQCLKDVDSDYIGMRAKAYSLLTIIVVVCENLMLTLLIKNSLRVTFIQQCVNIIFTSCNQDSLTKQIWLSCWTLHTRMTSFNSPYGFKYK